METVILMGLQASGKSSFYQARFSKTHVHISKDLFPNAKRKETRQSRLLEEALAAGRSVVVDNTNPTKEDRARLIQTARAKGAKIIGYYFESVVEDCLKRNESRSGKKKVPKVAVLGTAKRLERPRKDEGFDQLYHVSLGGEGQFRIEAWMEEAA